MPLHITLSKLIFTSHCICFYYIMICPVLSVYTIGVVLLAWLNALTVGFEQVIIPVILLTVLFANQIMICFRSAALVLLVLSCLLNPKVLAGDFEQVIVPVICFLPCLLTRYWFVSCCHGFRLFCICGVLADFEQVIILILLYLALFVN